MPLDMKFRLLTPLQRQEVADFIDFLLHRADAPQPEFAEKINALNAAKHDPLFLRDLQATAQDFEAVDAEGWDE